MSTNTTRGVGPDTLGVPRAALDAEIDAVLLKIWTTAHDEVEAAFQVRLDAVQSQLATANQKVDVLRNTLWAKDEVVAVLENIVRAKDALLHEERTRDARARQTMMTRQTEALQAQGDTLGMLLARLERAKQRVADLKSTTSVLTWAGTNARKRRIGPP
jgi:predicted metal-dependent hydrolase